VEQQTPFNRQPPLTPQTELEIKKKEKRKKKRREVEGGGIGSVA
jgi:hypothetical protein